MTTVQTSYTQPTDSQPGVPVNTTIRGFVTNRVCEPASIDFGLAAFAGTTDEDADITGTIPLGIFMKDPGNEMDASGDGQYVQYGTVSIIDQDFVWVTTASTSGAYGATVCANLTTGAITIGEPTPGTTIAIGWLAQTVTAAGMIRIFVNSRMSNEMDAQFIQGVYVDDTAKADDYILKYDDGTGTFGYEVDAT